MKAKINVIILLCITVFCCIANDYQVEGVWIYKELYDNWKKNTDDELIVSSDININGNIFIGLPHSIIISDEYMNVPGAMWKIDKIEKNGNKVKIFLSSSMGMNFQGYLEISFLANDLIYFSGYGGDNGFIVNCEQSFLLFGKGNIYNRADRKSHQNNKD
jgi:hypothetical protein